MLYHWNVIISGATSDESFVKVTTFPFSRSTVRHCHSNHRHSDSLFNSLFRSFSSQGITGPLLGETIRWVSKDPVMQNAFPFHYVTMYMYSGYDGLCPCRICMMTSWNENIFRVTGPCTGNSPVTGHPHKGQWRGALFFFFDLRLTKRLSKQSRRRWFETLSRSLWRHCNGLNHSHITEQVRMIQPKQNNNSSNNNNNNNNNNRVNVLSDILYQWNGVGITKAISPRWN